ncbi:MAG TPA: hypothetical protein VJ946_03975, partial [Bacteroidales bacterium]|nr:hypothetical protein [Bacteroidales bacterium]
MMLVTPDKERSPGVWQPTSFWHDFMQGSNAKIHAKSDSSGHILFYRHIVPNGTSNITYGYRFPGWLVGYGNHWLSL